MLAVPICKRPAIHANVIVVSQRNCRANSTLPGSPLRRQFNSASVQPNRANASRTDNGSLISIHLPSK